MPKTTAPKTTAEKRAAKLRELARKEYAAQWAERGYDGAFKSEQVNSDGPAAGLKGDAHE